MFYYEIVDSPITGVSKGKCQDILSSKCFPGVLNYCLLEDSINQGATFLNDGSPDRAGFFARSWYTLLCYASPPCAKHVGRGGPSSRSLKTVQWLVKF